MKKGADPNIIDNQSCTVLHWAALYGEIKKIKILLQYNADVNIKNNKGATPFMYSCCSGVIEAVELLLAAGGLVNDTTKDGFTALCFAANRGYSETSKQFDESKQAENKKYADIIQFLLDHGADKTLKTKKGKTTLSIAQDKMFLSVVKILDPEGQYRDELDRLIAEKQKISVPNLTMEVEENGTPGLRFLPIKNGREYTIVNLNGGNSEARSVDELIIPATQKGFPVTKISDIAVAGFLFSKITIPNSITDIAKEVFRDCENLTDLIIPASVTTIKSGLTSGCNSLTSIVVDSNNKVFRSENNCVMQKNTLVAGCKTSVFPKGITKIGSRAFAGCKSLSHITIPEGVTMIDCYAFFDCINLKSVVLPACLKTIMRSAFGHCPLDTVFYGGNKETLKTVKTFDSIKCMAEEWNQSVTNKRLLDAVYYFYSETKPTDEGNYWHFNASRKPVVWKSSKK